MVALYLVCSEHFPEQFPAVDRCVAQSLLNQFRAFLLAHCVTYRVINARVKHHNNGKAVCVGRHIAALGLLGVLVQQFHGPAVKCPHQEWGSRTAALNLHFLVVSEI